MREWVPSVDPNFPGCFINARRITALLDRLAVATSKAMRPWAFLHRALRLCR